MKSSFYGILDRMEGKMAVLLVGDDGETIELSLSLLPEGTKEGDLISFKLEKKDKKTKAEKEKVETLIKKLSL
jgi:hypothetical protein